MSLNFSTETRGKLGINEMGNPPERKKTESGAEYSERLWAYTSSRNLVYNQVGKVIKENLMLKGAPVKAALEKKDGHCGWFYAIYKEIVYKFDRPDYSGEEMLLQVIDLEDEERRKFEHLKHKFSVAKQEGKEDNRKPIPEEVRIVVWRRDDGKCTKCGNRENLEYDHIIPVSKGGSNTVRNIELLCEKCNREKHDRIQ